MVTWARRVVGVLSGLVIVALAAAPAAAAGTGRSTHSAPVCGPALAGLASCHSFIVLGRSGVKPFAQHQSPGLRAGRPAVSLQIALFDRGQRADGCDCRRL